MGDVRAKRVLGVHHGLDQVAGRGVDGVRAVRGPLKGFLEMLL